jgi:hypothetical protein
LPEVPGDPDLVLPRRRRRIPIRIIQLLQTPDSGDVSAVDPEVWIHECARGRGLGSGGDVYGDTQGIDEEIRVHWLGPTEVRRGLHQFDVLVQVLGKAVMRRADEQVSVGGMPPDVKLLQVIGGYKGRRNCEKGQKKTNGMGFSRRKRGGLGDLPYPASHPPAKPGLEW